MSEMRGRSFSTRASQAMARRRPGSEAGLSASIARCTVQLDTPLKRKGDRAPSPAGSATGRAARKIGRRLHGVPVLGPEALPPAGDTFVVSYVRSAGAREAIEARLRAAGYRLGVDYILAA